MLHITNGDSAAGSLRVSGLPGVVLAWRDILHDGPVPAGLTLDELRPVRARYIAEQRWGAYDAVLADFTQRDATLKDANAEDQIVLWFEHDLYDQLQLLQLLDWFAEHPLQGKLSLLCIGAHPDFADFSGLGQLTPAQLAALFPQRHAVTEAELALGRAAWTAFRAPDPTAIERLLDSDTSALLYLRAALERHLEEYPDAHSGLARSEQNILRAIADGEERPHYIYRASQVPEEAVYLGDWPVWARLTMLAEGPTPLVAQFDGAPFLAPAEYPPADDFLAQRLTLTDAGRAALADELDWIEVHSADSWRGGVHLRSPDAVWRWEAATRRIVPPA
jgi:Domain of unknown function (DUF1835)